MIDRLRFRTFTTSNSTGRWKRCKDVAEHDHAVSLKARQGCSESSIAIPAVSSDAESRTCRSISETRPCISPLDISHTAVYRHILLCDTHNKGSSEVAVVTESFRLPFCRSSYPGKIASSAFGCRAWRYRNDPAQGCHLG